MGSSVTVGISGCVYCEVGSSFTPGISGCVCLLRRVRLLMLASRDVSGYGVGM